VPRLCRRLRPRAFSLYTACSLRSVATIYIYIPRRQTRRLQGTLERRAMIYSATAYCHGGLRFRGAGSSISRTSSFGDFPRVERNPALTSVLVHSHGGPGPSQFQPALTVVFRHTGHHINSARLVFEAHYATSAPNV
jgi:hypothetical protein